MNETTINNTDRLIELTTDIVSAYVSNNPVPVGDLPHLIAEIHAALQQQVAPTAQQEAEPKKPAVPIKKSITPDHIVCLEDGKKFKSLKRHLATTHGVTPDEYRTKWGLPADYPMVAPAYSAARSALAKSTGLGRKTEAVAVAPAAPARRKKLGLKFS
ncbi:MucR family transcriptional regulator [Aquamicrobium defluvii]|uniref:MucR family transcriptional regulator n=1 Tax=Aquamicrobium defluvii TaxID=69279 RepID=A0A4R6Y6X9_9HYPH|nr:MucR family transcriptional regulator [Aquamicrobium defluvii]TDR29108.1 MucR family transcriptional regulator [Aquamicrobium defluvii]